MRFRVEEWWLAKRLVIAHNHQPSTCVLLYAEFSMPVKCVLRWAGQCCLTASKICWQLDSQGVGWLRMRDRCEQSDVEERLCHNYGLVLSKQIGVRLEYLQTTHTQLRQVHPSEWTESWANTWPLWLLSQTIQYSSSPLMATLNFNGKIFYKQ